MVVHHRRPFWTLLASLTTAAFVYLTLINTTIDQGLEKTKPFEKNVRNVVAYSLLKQIEIESEQYSCSAQSNASETNYNHSAINESDEAGIEDDTSGWNHGAGWTHIGGSGLYVFSVHMDRRLDPYNFVRIIGAIKGSSHGLFYCNFSSLSIQYVTKVTITPIWLDIWNQNDTNVYFNPVLLSCRIPFGVTPKSVSVTKKPCDKVPRKQFLISQYTGKRQHMFTVCVKPLDFLEDISKRLVQWIELIHLLGAEKIVIYVRKVKENVWRVLKWYSSTYPGKIVVRTFKPILDTFDKTNNFSRTLWQKRRYEVVSYNDCFYRNVASSHFVVPLDIDEIIIPKQVYTWDRVLQHTFISSPEISKNFASFMVPNAYFFGDVQKEDTNNVFFLRNTYRSQLSPPGESGKSFISTKNTLTVFNHYTLDVLKPGVSRSFFLPSNVIQLNHYKETCNTVILPECVKYISSPKIKDSIIYKYKKVFMKIYLKRISSLQKFCK